LKKKFKNLKKADEKEEKIKPTHFDLEPFQKAFKDFVALNSEVRSEIRIEMKKESDVIDSIFVDKYGERSFKQCVDIKWNYRETFEMLWKFRLSAQGSH